jgi:hypothetical protein
MNSDSDRAGVLGLSPLGVSTVAESQLPIGEKFLKDILIHHSDGAKTPAVVNVTK